MKKLLCVDGNSLINRAFYGVKPLTSREGKNTNATFGFIKMLSSQLSSLKPDYAAAAYDLKSPTFRHLKYDFYKATRKGMQSELAEQIEDCRLAASLMGFHKITAEGFEADDILGTLSNFASEDIQVYILTGDRDSFQLVNENVTVLYLSTKETTAADENFVKEKYGLEPKKLIEIKALMGDSSDNIPGVKGIGEKTAIELIKNFGSVEELYKNIDSEKISKSVRAKLEEGKDSAFASRFLGEINKNVPLGIKLEELEYKGINKKGLLALCEELDLDSIISKLELRKIDGSEEKEDVSEKIKLEYTGILSVKETGEEEISLYLENGSVYICGKSGRLYKSELNDETAREIFENEKLNVALYDVKSVKRELRKYGVKEIKCGFYDVMLASYLINPASVLSDEGVVSAFGTFGIDVGDGEQRAMLYAKNLLRLKEDTAKSIKDNGQEKLLYEVEFPLAIVLEETEHAGFKIDKEKLENYGRELDEKILSRQNKIYLLAGEEFNINSPKQLGKILFEKMGLNPVKKTKSGYSTDAESLERLRADSPIIDEILDYRTVSKLKSTYAEGLLNALSEDGRIHTSFKQAFTLTGRLSSADPNLQNIPVRTPEGRAIRRVFIPEEGNVLIDADYSQIELRVMAAISGDEGMISAFESGEDIHAATASQVFGVEKDKVTPEMRKKAKAVNFGVIYGISDFSLAGDLKISRKEAADYIERYFEKYPAVKAYLDGVKARAATEGYVSTFFGRRRYVPELSSRIYAQRTFGERVAMNAPIQGTAADIIKIAMLRVYNALKAEGLDAKLILQVHDELILECSEKDAKRAAEILKNEMSRDTGLGIFLDAETKIGVNWEECHG